MSGKAGRGPRVSLPEVHASVSIPVHRNLLRRIFAISGPAYLVSVGYMDPGNWATDLAAGSSFNYSLLWVLLMSNLMALLLQGLATRLGIVRGLDLAQACRVEYGRSVNFALYLLCEVAITACDLAEVLGSAIALQLLFGLPLLWGVLLTAADTFGLIFLSQFGIRKLEALVLSLITLIGGGLFLEVFLAKPDWGGVFSGLMPTLPGYTALFVAMGMLGATVMPHNLYLHSSLVQTRRIGDDERSKQQAIRLNGVDSAIALNMAFFVNAAILIMAAAVFYRAGQREVAEIQDAYKLLEGILGTALAPAAFAIALLASGQSSTITGTLAGQIVMEGFLNIRIPPWVRRLITRLMAVAPAVITLLLFGERGTGNLLVLSQVVLSMQLPFAIVPLIHFVSDRKEMGRFALGRALKIFAWATAALILALNIWLIWATVGQWAKALGPRAPWLIGGFAPLFAGAGALLLYVTFKPWIKWLFVPRGKEVSVGVHEPECGSLGISEEQKPYERVALALDFTGRERHILRETLRFLGPSRPKLALIHIVESAGARFLGRESADVESQADLRRLEAYAAELTQMGFEVECHVGAGKPVLELTRLVSEFGADLVVLAAHGHRYLSDLLHGSTADALRHRISCSVLVVGKGSSQ
jgi:manganese transport protein